MTRKILESTLWEASSRLMRNFEIPWLPPLCPKCLGILSHKMASSRLICLKCNSEFELKEAETSGHHRRLEEKIREEDGESRAVATGGR